CDLRPQNQKRSCSSKEPTSPIRCQKLSPSRILCSALASVLVTYSVVTTGPRTINSPISPGGNSSASASVAIGSSLMLITFHSIPGNRLPTQVPTPVTLLAAVSASTSLAAIDATGSASVAPYGVCTSPSGGMAAFIRRSTWGGTGAPAERT